MTAEDEIRKLLGAYERALNRSDAPAAAACYSADGMFIAPGLPTASGEDILMAYEGIFANIRLAVAFTIDELSVVSEAVAIALTHSKGTQTVLDGGLETIESNRELFVFAVTTSGWRISRYLFNKPAPIATSDLNTATGR